MIPLRETLRNVLLTTSIAAGVGGLSMSVAFNPYTQLNYCSPETLRVLAFRKELSYDPNTPGLLANKHLDFYFTTSKDCISLLQQPHVQRELSQLELASQCHAVGFGAVALSLASLGALLLFRKERIVYRPLLSAHESLKDDASAQKRFAEEQKQLPDDFLVIHSSSTTNKKSLPLKSPHLKLVE